MTDKAKQKSDEDGATGRGTTPEEGDVPSPARLLGMARAQLAELTGSTAETVSSFQRTEHGWELEIDVLEVARVPDTTDLLGSYQVRLDPQGVLTGYRRLRRYVRGRAEPRGA
ncbi:gas vesicle protein GvpO [Streptomyces sp. NPDC102406]|uniref:gas vesicle protein GvpO n=1 Tax=Streptomyces sp. NPDC102406 TaxID=3366171 RepID=UPI00382AF0D5